MLGGRFAAVLIALAQTYGDRTVATIVLDPDARFYSEVCGFLPGFQVEAGSPETGYGTGLRYDPVGDPAGATEYAANVIAIAGSSGRWVLWGQRDWEIALLCTPQGSGPWERMPVPVFGRELVLDSIRSPAGWGVALGEAELREFWQSVR